MAERTKNITLTLKNGKKLLVKPHHTPENILKGVKTLDSEGSYPEYLKRYGEIQAKKDGDPSRLSANLDNLVSGATFGFADEIGAAGDATWDWITGKDSWKDSYDKHQAVNQANLEQSQESLGVVEKVLGQYGIPFVAARQVFAKLGSKGIEFARKKLGQAELRKEAKEAGLNKAEIEEWVKINELPTELKSKVAEYALKGAKGASTLGAIGAGFVGGPAGVGAGTADPGKRAEGAISGGVVGYNTVNKINPLASTFNPSSAIGQILPGFAEGGEVSSEKIRKIYNEGYTAPGQAYAIAKSMGYNQGGLFKRK